MGKFITKINKNYNNHKILYNVQSEPGNVISFDSQFMGCPWISFPNKVNVYVDDNDDIDDVVEKFVSELENTIDECCRIADNLEDDYENLSENDIFITIRSNSRYDKKNWNKLSFKVKDVKGTIYEDLVEWEGFSVELSLCIKPNNEYYVLSKLVETPPPYTKSHQMKDSIEIYDSGSFYNKSIIDIILGREKDKRSIDSIVGENKKKIIDNINEVKKSM